MGGDRSSSKGAKHILSLCASRVCKLSLCAVLRHAKGVLRLIHEELLLKLVLLSRKGMLLQRSRKLRLLRLLAERSGVVHAHELRFVYGFGFRSSIMRLSGAMGRNGDTKKIWFVVRCCALKCAHIGIWCWRLNGRGNR